MAHHTPPPPPPPILNKCPTGILGLDMITRGGLPRGRPTLVCGGSGSGKTLLAMEFLVRGIQEHDEVDLIEDPQLAREGQIVALPTLVRRLPRRCARSSAI